MRKTMGDRANNFITTPPGLRECTLLDRNGTLADVSDQEKILTVTHYYGGR